VALVLTVGRENCADILPLTLFRVFTKPMIFMSIAASLPAHFESPIEFRPRLNGRKRFDDRDLGAPMPSARVITTANHG
jgi:hypothetical protein